MYAFKIFSCFLMQIGMFLHSLKVTVEAALWSIFSISTMVTLLLLPLVQCQKSVGTAGDGSNCLQGWMLIDQYHHRDG